jgi:transcriptional regulator with XRE-family HTH domain
LRQETPAQWPLERGSAGDVEAAVGSPEPTGPFVEWVRNQLRARRMSQRHLARKSGVHHTTLSRLMRGDRVPSLGTATKLADSLRALGDDTPRPYDLVTFPTHPIARVEYALRSDDLFGEPEVRRVMEYYLAVRMRRAEAVQRVPMATVILGSTRTGSTY